VNPGVVEEVCRGWLDATNGTAGRL
jgi:hypothetical protein